MVVGYHNLKLVRLHLFDDTLIRQKTKELSFELLFDIKRRMKHINKTNRSKITLKSYQIRLCAKQAYYLVEHSFKHNGI